MIPAVNPDGVDFNETCRALRFSVPASVVEGVSEIDHGQAQTQSSAKNGVLEECPDREEELLDEIYNLKLQLIDCEKRRCASEAETRRAVCNELQQQVQRREAEFLVQLEETEERARARAEKRFELWKKRMISESGSTIDIQAAIDVTKQKAEEDAARKLGKLQEQLEIAQDLHRQSELKYEQLHSQFDMVCRQRDEISQTHISAQNELKDARDRIDGLMGKLDVAIKQISDQEAALKEQNRANAALKQTVEALKQSQGEELKLTVAENKNFQKEIKQLKKKITSFESQLNKKKQAAKEQAAMHDRIAQLEIEAAKFADSIEEIQQLQQQLREMTKSNADLHAAIEVTKEKAEEDAARKLAKLQGQLEINQGLHKELELKYEHLQNQFEIVGRQRDEISQTHISEQNELKDARARIDELKENLETSIKKISELEAALEEENRAKTVLTQTVQTLKQSQAEELKASLSEKKSLQKENKQLQKKIASLEFQHNKKTRTAKEQAALHERIAQMEIESAKFADSQEEIQQLQRQLSEMTKLTVDLNAKIEITKQKAEEDAARNLTKLQEQLGITQNLHKESLLKYEQLQSQFESVCRQRDEISQSHITVQNELKATRNHLDELMEKLDTAIKKIADQNAAFEEQQRTNAALQQTIETLKQLQSDESKVLVAEKKNLQKENKQKKIAALELQQNKKPRTAKDQAALHDRIAQLEIEAAKFADSQDEIQQLHQQISEMKKKDESFQQLTKENDSLRQRIHELESAADRRKRIELQKQALEKQLAELESTSVKDMNQGLLDSTSPALNDDISQSSPSVVKKDVFIKRSNKQQQPSRAFKIISSADQENVSVPRTFGKRSRAILEENLKWSSILTSDPFDDITKKTAHSPELKKKPIRKPLNDPATPRATRRSTRSGR